jgi:SAM-dependent methyltransferase
MPATSQARQESPFPASSSAAPGDPYDYESIDPGYYDRIYRRGSGIQSKWHHLKFERLRRLLRPGAEHLDIGCGPGTFIGTLDPTIRSTGVDIASTQVCYATGTYGAAHRRFQRIEAGTLPFAAGSFDAITCVELVEHLSREAGQELCREARRVLRRDGTFVVTTPDYGGLWPLLEKAVNRLGDVSYEEQHVTHYTRERLASLLRDSGYARVEVERFQFLAPFAAGLGWRAADVVARWEPGWLTRRLGFLLLAVARV